MIIFLFFSSSTTTNNNDTPAQSISSILDSTLSSDINNPKPHTSQSSSPSPSHNNNLSFNTSSLDQSLHHNALHENIREATIFISQVKNIYHNRFSTLYDTIRNQNNNFRNATELNFLCKLMDQMDQMMDIYGTDLDLQPLFHFTMRRFISVRVCDKDK
eukprot:Pgem_evm1s2109